MSENQFAFSGHPNYLEWYKCYDDLSSKEWLDGMDLKSHSDTWDERAIAKWHFFYRPFRTVVGRPQKKMINERRAVISACEVAIEEARAGVVQEEARIRQATSWLTNWTVVLGLMAVVAFFFVSKWLVLLPLAGGLIAFHKFSEERRDARAKISALEATIATKSSGIQESSREIELLKEEISYLLSQVPHVVDSMIIESWLNEEIAEMECVCLSEFLSLPISREDIRKHIPQGFGDPRVCGLLIDSWGFLQPTAQKGPLGREGTGLRRATDELQQYIATWQVGSNGIPTFRLLFLQYIFPLERNLNVCSFFYDFITRRAFGKRFDTFQYNHITNYSLREIEPEEEPWMEDLGLSSMSALLQGKTPKALTIALASGNHFRCVLVDEDIVDALNEWLTHEEKFKQLKTELEAGLDNPELKKSFGDDKRFKDWKVEEQSRIEAEMNELIREKQQIHFESGRTAKAMLAHVRSCVEQYIFKFKVPA
jgi:hypothetical protein